MKRILVAMLIISMTAGMTLQNVKASDEEVYYSESQMESIAQNYTENEYCKLFHIKDFLEDLLHD